MRALKIIVVAVVAAIAVAAGLVAAAVAALIALAYFAVNRLIGESRKPVDRPMSRRSTRKQSDDAIDVTATEVASVEHERPPEIPSDRT